MKYQTVIAGLLIALFLGCPQGGQHHGESSQPNPSGGIPAKDRVIRVNWLMDWADYGGTAAIDKKDIQKVIKFEAGVPVFPQYFQPRFYGESIDQLGHDIPIFAGNKFYLVLDKTDSAKYAITLHGDICAQKEFPTAAARFIRVECTSPNLPAHYYAPLGSLISSQKLLFTPRSNHVFDDNLTYHQAEPYTPYASKYWNDHGVNLAAIPGFKETNQSHSSECVLIAEKIRFALGYFKSQGLDAHIKATLPQLIKAEASLSGSDCHSMGSGPSLPCYAGGSGCGLGGWGEIYEARGEFSERQGLYAKHRYFIGAASADEKQKWQKTQADLTVGKLVPIYDESQVIWGGNHAPEQMNKVGRIWQFIANPALISRLPD